MNKIANVVSAIGAAVSAATLRLQWGDDGRISAVSVFGIRFFDRQRREKRLRAKANRDKR